MWFDRGCSWSTGIVRSGGRFSKCRCMRKNEIRMRMMRVEAKFRIVVVSESESSGEAEGVLESMELETVVMLHRS